MFNKFIKKSSKFFAVLLTATLAFTPLSYGAGPATFADLGVAISDGTTPNTITLDINLEATTTDESLGAQGATELENYPDAEVLVEGHTDNVGSDEVNQKISEQRASSVATSLKKDYGVKNNISAIGKGKTEPIASNATAEGRAKNRRVEIILTTAE